ncbi:MAG TPA: class I lanthipeptide [Thermoanaerobaculia bacterium]|nr:class I lanthipeptide [Thermoanaerobaculia bacterium]
MKKTTLKKLSLNRETLVSLTETGLRDALGGSATGHVGTCEVSICLGCTGKLDSCPVAQTVVDA